MNYPLVYELNTRCWLRELSAAANQPLTLAAVPEAEFLRWRELGFTHLWLMGVWESGPQARAVARADAKARQGYGRALPDWTDADVDASPYAVCHYRIAAELGGEAALTVFRDRLHAAGLKLMLDFIPNHVGLDHPWLIEHPEFFVRSYEPRGETFHLPNATGPAWFAHGKDPNFPAWTDTAQLDHRHPELRAAVIADLVRVADLCDGVRCDMAMLQLNDVFRRNWKAFPTAHPPLEREFWTEAIAAVWRQRPDFLFLAESYWGMESALQTLGFDYTYDKVLYDELVYRDPSAITRHLLEDSSPGFVQHSAHFIENHDEQRAAAVFYPAEHRAAALLVLGLHGLRLVHEGQLTGAKYRTSVQLIRRAVETPSADLRAMYVTLLRGLRESSVGHGRPVLIRPRPAWPDNQTWRNLLLIQWQAHPEQFDLVVVNLVPHRAQCYAPLTIADLPNHHWSMRDLLGTERYLRVGADLEQQGLYLDVPPYAAQIFHFQPAG
jgi:glycosidase